MNDKEVTNYVNTHIAQIIYIANKTMPKHKEYIVKFENVPEELDIRYNTNDNFGDEDYIHGMRKIYMREIKNWAKSKEELEHHISANKYNL